MNRIINSSDQLGNFRGQDHPPSASTETSRKENRNGTYISSISSGSLSIYDEQSKDPTTDGRRSRTASASTKSIVTGTTLRPSALAFSNQQAVELSKRVSEQIIADKAEVVNMIANYAVEPSEMLHLVERWMQRLLGEFKRQRDSFKYRLSDKWQNEELPNLTYENHDHLRQVYAAYRDLEQARTGVLSQKSFDQLNNYVHDISESETAAMKERFNEVADHYSKILHALEVIDREVYHSSNGSFTSDTKNTLAKLKQLNNKETHTICIVGLEKAGKSTYTNALLGYELVPTAAERCTQVRTVLKPPSGNVDQSLLATVKFYDDDEFQFFYEKMVKKTDETDDQFKERQRRVMVVREDLKSKLKFPDEYFRVDNLNGFETDRSAICRELRDYITDEVYCNIIKEISIYSNKLRGQNYELLDVPGFDSPIKEHRTAGLDAVKNADAFVFLTNGQQPNLTQPQIRLLTEIQQNHFEAMQRAFGIITKLDLCLTSTTYADHHDKAVNELIAKKFKRDHIYVACPRIESVRKDSDEYDAIHQKLNTFGEDIRHGFERSKDALNKFIEYELPKTHLKQLIELGRARLCHSVIERLNLIREKRIIPDGLVDASIDDYIHQQKMESWDQIYETNIFQPAFEKANDWHSKVVTSERLKFIEDVRQTFHDTFREKTKQFLSSTEDIQRQLHQTYTYTKLQLNPHQLDSDIREQLCFALEQIVDDTSDILAKHFYDQYVCGLESIIHNACPYLKDLYRAHLTLERCMHETHAMILRICRPMIIATLRYSHLDSEVKTNAITEFIYVAPTVAYNIACTTDQQGSNGIAETNICNSIQFLLNNNEMTTKIIRTLFNIKD